MAIYDRLPPQNLEAERAVLGACLLEHEALGTAIETLQPEDFYDLNHRTIYLRGDDRYVRGQLPRGPCYD